MFIEPPPINAEIAELREWCHKLQGLILEDDLTGSETWNPGNVADGEMVSNDVTVTGAVLGDYAIASFSLDIEDLVLDAQVTVADTVTVTLTNDGIGAGVNLAEGTIYTRVFRRTT